jgi:hypothetical protein
VDSARSMQGCAAHQQHREPFFHLQDKIFGARFQASVAASMRLMFVWVVTLRYNQKSEDLKMFNMTYGTLFISYGNDGYANATRYYVTRILHILLN